MTSNFILQSLQKSPNLQILHFKVIRKFVTLFIEKRNI
jgi:hypothetical protein